MRTSPQDGSSGAKVTKVLGEKTLAHVSVPCALMSTQSYGVPSGAFGSTVQYS